MSQSAPNKPFIAAMFHKRAVTRFHNSYCKKGASECWPWAKRRFKTGYGKFRIWGRVYKANRVAYFVAHKVDPGALCVCHTCDNPDCVNPAHLFLGTPADNVADKMRKNRHVASPGERHGMHKLTETQVLAIRQADGSQRAIAKLFGISQKQVFSILHRKSWKHL